MPKVHIGPILEYQDARYADTGTYVTSKGEMAVVGGCGDSRYVVCIDENAQPNTWPIRELMPNQFMLRKLQPGERIVIEGDGA